MTSEDEIKNKLRSRDYSLVDVKTNKPTIYEIEDGGIISCKADVIGFKHNDPKNDILSIAIASVVLPSKDLINNHKKNTVNQDLKIEMITSGELLIGDSNNRTLKIIPTIIQVIRLGKVDQKGNPLYKIINAHKALIINETQAESSNTQSNMYS